ncbi:YciI family protein [Ralstonia mannitolilytica]|uniref:YCII-related domain-containing protein n=1 Tax=Ralstonia mannitolilytica TaxID=105219 RepID=A0AAD2EH99_9RALS|nr:YciI family protein [Ralstonia mannitolilytica]MBY4720307.1 YciI family protein [Ralstonia mannitolilytica]CAJ0678951.1 hypothetical protein R77591_00042 [Ralstonia mannitolilytica]CAJ0698148.1 hypothetical protein LMG18102_02651 [Ralstonia mannitolilytica]CAJ0707954.1 hypothetical protein LMG8323_00130 [Ralstonia mannitolilytica]CAJ0867619.1 hypothetical protein R77569_01992 [Ralstonia mannitolilytica]
MFIVLLHYIQPISIVESYLKEHRDYLDRYFKAEKFIASGPQVPRIGGVILASARSRAELDDILSEDPFYREKVAQYQIIEFNPTKFGPGVQFELPK